MMLKNTLLFLSVFIAFKKANASNVFKPTDTITYYMKNDTQLAGGDSVAFVRRVVVPDNADKNTLYPVLEYYNNGKRKFTGISRTPSHILLLDGPATNFFANGKRKNNVNYSSNVIVGDEIDYYPNGKLYAIKKYPSSVKFGEPKPPLLVECHDSTGTVLAENGNGRWLKYDDSLKTIYQEGTIKDGIEDGSWSRIIKGTKYEFEYTKGMITKPSNYDSGEEVMTKPDILPSFKGGLDAFGKFLGSKIRFPGADLEKHVQGKVMLSFIVEKDGTLSHFEIEQAPSETLAAEAVRVMKISPLWLPGTIAGAPVRTKYNLPINFGIGR